MRSDNEADELVVIQLLEFKAFVMGHVEHTSPLSSSTKMGKSLSFAYILEFFSGCSHSSIVFGIAFGTK